jgi:hypothetical protein
MYKHQTHNDHDLLLIFAWTQNDHDSLIISIALQVKIKSK